jgi:hypothetical protein
MILVRKFGLPYQLVTGFNLDQNFALGGIGKVAPIGNFVNGAHAACAKAGAFVDDANIDTGRCNFFTHVWLRKRSQCAMLRRNKGWVTGIEYISSV